MVPNRSEDLFFWSSLDFGEKTLKTLGEDLFVSYGLSFYGLSTDYQYIYIGWLLHHLWSH